MESEGHRVAHILFVGLSLGKLLGLDKPQDLSKLLKPELL